MAQSGKGELSALRFQRGDEATRLQPRRNPRMGFRSVLRNRSAASTSVAHRSSQRATSKSTCAANRNCAAVSTCLAGKLCSKDLFKFLRAFIVPSCRFGGGAALRRELHFCFSDQLHFELKIRTLCRHGHARPIGQPTPNAGGSLCDGCAGVAHRVLKSAGYLTRRMA